MRKIKMGAVGLGNRGHGMLNTFLATGNVEFVALCDTYEDRVNQSAENVKNKQGYEPRKYQDFNEFIKDKDLEAVYICSSWKCHTKMAIECMKHGIIAAMEVGGARELEEVQELVDTYEKTKTPFMFMENCNYDKFELQTLIMARKNMFGEIVHCHGAYSHDLREEITGGNINRHYRLEEYTKYNCENYPTHEIGPIAKILDINRGNRFTKLVSFSSKACSLHEFANSEKVIDKTLKDVVFNQGDVVTTMIQCENGETITLTLDTTLPKFYAREVTIRGTKGFAIQDINAIGIEGINKNEKEVFKTADSMKEYMDSAEKFGEYLPEFWKNITKEEMELGHGGMDFFMCKSFTENVLNNKPMPIDVYDAATWMAITALSKMSIEQGGITVDFPDFTKGEYKNRDRFDVIEIK